MFDDGGGGVAFDQGDGDDLAATGGDDVVAHDVLGPVITAFDEHVGLDEFNQFSRRVGVEKDDFVHE